MQKALRAGLMFLSERLSRFAQESFCLCVRVGVRRLSAMLHISHYFELPQTCHSISQFDVCVRSEFYTQWRRSGFLLCSRYLCAVKIQEQLLIKTNGSTDEIKKDHVVSLYVHTRYK